MTLNCNVYQDFSAAFDLDKDFARIPGGPTYSYRDLDSQSAAIAGHFSELGVKPGDRVIVQVEKSVTNLFVYFACLRAGFVCVPLNTAYVDEEVAFFCADASPALVVCDPSREDTFNRLADCPVRTLDAQGRGSAIPNQPRDFGTAMRARDDTAVILYTSGTTGRPKGAMISHHNLLANARTLYSAWQWQPSDVLIHALPVFHIHGLFVATHLAVLGNCPMIFLHRFDAGAVVEALPEATVYMGVPTNYVRLLDEPRLNAEACRHMRLFTSGSAPLLTQTFNDFHHRTGHRIVERYGMTETGMNTSNPLDGERRPGTVGPPLPGVEVRIDAPPRQPGMLYVRGENVFKGYWQLPDKTAEEFDGDGYFRTGDVATMDDDGYIAIVGRDKDMIISGGLNVYPKEIETVIDDSDDVTESAVIGVPHPDFGEAVVAVIVARKDSDLSENEIINLLKSRLANFKVAKRAIFVDRLPRNAMGKVQKARLRDQYAKLFTS